MMKFQHRDYYDLAFQKASKCTQLRPFLLSRSDKALCPPDLNLIPNFLTEESIKLQDPGQARPQLFEEIFSKDNGNQYTGESLSHKQFSMLSFQSGFELRQTEECEEIHLLEEPIVENLDEQIYDYYTFEPPTDLAVVDIILEQLNALIQINQDPLPSNLIPSISCLTILEEPQPQYDALDPLEHREVCDEIDIEDFFCFQDELDTQSYHAVQQIEPEVIVAGLRSSLNNDFPPFEEFFGPKPEPPGLQLKFERDNLVNSTQGIELPIFAESSIEFNALSYTHLWTNTNDKILSLQSVEGLPFYPRGIRDNASFTLQQLIESDASYDSVQLKCLPVRESESSSFLPSISLLDLLTDFLEIGIQPVSSWELDLSSYWLSSHWQHISPQIKTEETTFVGWNNPISILIPDLNVISLQPRIHLEYDEDYCQVEPLAESLSPEELEDIRFIQLCQEAASLQPTQYDDNSIGHIFRYRAMVDSLHPLNDFKSSWDFPWNDEQTTKSQSSPLRKSTSPREMAHQRTNIASIQALSSDDPKLVETLAQSKNEDIIHNHANPIDDTQINIQGEDVARPSSPSKSPLIPPPSTVDSITTPKIRPTVALEDPLEAFMKLKGKGPDIPSSAQSFIWPSSYKLKQIPGMNSYAYQFALVDQIRDKNSLLVMPHELFPIGVICLLIYNYLSLVPQCKIVWSSSSKQDLLDTYSLFQRYFLQTNISHALIDSPNQLLAQNSAWEIIFVDSATLSVLQDWKLIPKLNLLILLLGGFNPQAGTSFSSQQEANFATCEVAEKGTNILAFTTSPPSNASDLSLLVDKARLERILCKSSLDSNLPDFLKSQRNCFAQPSDNQERLFGILCDIFAPLISFLYQMDVFTDPELTINQFTPTMTYEIVKAASQQLDRLTEDELKRDEEFTETCKCLIQLHVLICLATYLLRDGIPSAFHYLESSFQNPMYGTLLTFTFEDLHRDLATLFDEIEAGLYSVHPKLELLLTILKQASASSPFKALVIVDSNMIHNTINAVRRISALICNSADEVPPQSLSEEQLHSWIQQFNCIILAVEQLPASLPLRSFSLVVEIEYHGINSMLEFENVEDIKCQRFCIQTLHPFLRLEETTSFTSDRWTDAARLQFGSEPILMASVLKNGKWPTDVFINYDASQYNFNIKQEFMDAEELIPITLIAGEKLIQRQELVHTLERNQNIKIIERTLSYENGAFSMLILDERTCVIIYDSPTSNFDCITSVASKLSVAFEKVWVIFQNSTQSTTNSFRLSEEFITSYGTYLGGISTVPIAMILRFSSSVEETAGLIREACEDASNSEVWSQSLEVWSDRRWLQESESRHEQFLCKFPSFHPFSAQLTLTWVSLEEILTSPLQQLIDKLPWIPPIILERYCSAIESALSRELFQEVPAYSKRPASNLVSEKNKQPRLATMFENFAYPRNVNLNEKMELSRSSQYRPPSQDPQQNPQSARVRAESIPDRKQRITTSASTNSVTPTRSNWIPSSPAPPKPNIFQEPNILNTPNRPAPHSSKQIPSSWYPSYQDPPPLQRNFPANSSKAVSRTSDQSTNSVTPTRSNWIPSSPAPPKPTFLQELSIPQNEQYELDQPLQSVYHQTGEYDEPSELMRKFSQANTGFPQHKEKNLTYQHIPGSAQTQLCWKPNKKPRIDLNQDDAEAVNLVCPPQKKISRYEKQSNGWDDYHNQYQPNSALHDHVSQSYQTPSYLQNTQRQSQRSSWMDSPYRSAAQLSNTNTQISSPSTLLSPPSKHINVARRSNILKNLSYNSQRHEELSSASSSSAERPHYAQAPQVSGHQQAMMNKALFYKLNMQVPNAPPNSSQSSRRDRY